MNEINQIGSDILNFWDAKIGHMSIKQAEYILNRLKQHNIHNVLEIGFAGGRHTYAILQSFKPKKMVSIDINFDYQCGRQKMYQIKKEFKQIEFVEKDSKIALTVEFMVNKFPDGLDYVLIDGGHTYNDAMSDIKNTYPFLNTNGIMIIDDYKSKVCPIKDVDNAVIDFSKQNNIPYEEVSTEDGKGMAIFVK